MSGDAQISRKAKWTESAAIIVDKSITVTTAFPKEGFKEFYVEMGFQRSTASSTT